MTLEKTGAACVVILLLVSLIGVAVGLHGEEEIEFILENGTDTGLHPEANKDWMFHGWQGLDEEYDEDTGVTFFTITEDKSTTVVLVEEDEPETYELTLIIDGPGTVRYDYDKTPIDIQEIEDEDRWVFTVEEGTEFTLMIDEDDQGDFEEWDLPEDLEIEMDADSLRLTFEVYDDHEFTANFEEGIGLRLIIVIMIIILIFGVVLIVFALLLVKKKM